MPRSPGRRARLGAALLRVGADLRLSRLATMRAIANAPSGDPGRDLALASLGIGGWVDAVLLWAGWRLCPRDGLLGGPPGT